ncbi:MAG: hypothetical protein V1811_01845, partial [Candidatus Micrarchaeota archaeon]
PQIKQTQPNEHEPHPSIRKVLSMFTLPKLKLPQIKIQQQKPVEITQKASAPFKPKPIETKAKPEKQKQETAHVLPAFKKPVLPVAKQKAPEAANPLPPVVEKQEKPKPVEKTGEPEPVEKTVVKHAPGRITIKHVHHAKAKQHVKAAHRAKEKPTPVAIKPKKSTITRPKHEKHKARPRQVHTPAPHTIKHEKPKATRRAYKPSPHAIKREKRKTKTIHTHIIQKQLQHHAKKKREDESLRVWTDVRDIGRKKHHEHALIKQGLVTKMNKGGNSLSEANARRFIEKLEGKAKRRGRK